eukprot:763080-Hanusia_phi.AAC.2
MPRTCCSRRGPAGRRLAAHTVTTFKASLTVPGRAGTTAAAVNGVPPRRRARLPGFGQPLATWLGRGP